MAVSYTHLDVYKRQLFDFELTGLDFLLQLEGIDIRFILIIEHGERSA